MRKMIIKFINPKIVAANYKEISVNYEVRGVETITSIKSKNSSQLGMAYMDPPLAHMLL
ncbi:MAG: hypothetical protein HQ521_08985 [Bacteroidetes bacterium]|nr:hypothetical protein [Bacteroidota bacterium]